MRRKVADLAACSPVELLARSEKLVEPLDSVAGSRRRDKLAVAPVLHDGAPRRSNLRRWLVAVVRVVGLVEPHEKRPVHCRRDWCVHSDRVKAPVRASDTHTHTHTHTHTEREESEDLAESRHQFMGVNRSSILPSSAAFAQSPTLLSGSRYLLRTICNAFHRHPEIHPERHIE